MKLATTTGDFSNYGANQLDALSYIKEAGFSYADYNFHVDYVKRDGVYSDGHKEYFDKVKAHCERIGISLVQAHAPMGDPIAKDNDRFIRDTVRCVEACGEWGIKNLVVHSGYEEGLTKEQTLIENKRFFTPVLKAAEIYGVNILVENFNKRGEEIFWIDKASELLELIELVDHPFFHAVWDVGHANMHKMPQNEELLLLGDHVRALHIQDNNGMRDDHLTPFIGTLNMDSVMRGLIDIGYTGYFTFEVGRVFTPPEIKRQFSSDERLLKAPLELKRAYEKYLYELGKITLSSYGLFEE